MNNSGFQSNAINLSSFFREIVQHVEALSTLPETLFNSTALELCLSRLEKLISLIESQIGINPDHTYIDNPVLKHYIKSFNKSIEILRHSLWFLRSIPILENEKKYFFFRGSLDIFDSTLSILDEIINIFFSDAALSYCQQQIRNNISRLYDRCSKVLSSLKLADGKQGPNNDKRFFQGNSTSITNDISNPPKVLNYPNSQTAYETKRNRPEVNSFSQNGGPQNSAKREANSYSHNGAPHNTAQRSEVNSFSQNGGPHNNAQREVNSYSQNGASHNTAHHSEVNSYSQNGGLSRSIAQSCNTSAPPPILPTLVPSSQYESDLMSLKFCHFEHSVQFLNLIQQIKDQIANFSFESKQGSENLSCYCKLCKEPVGAIAEAARHTEEQVHLYLSQPVKIGSKAELKLLSTYNEFDWTYIQPLPKFDAFRCSVCEVIIPCKLWSWMRHLQSESHQFKVKEQESAVASLPILSTQNTTNYNYHVQPPTLEEQKAVAAPLPLSSAPNTATNSRNLISEHPLTTMLQSKLEEQKAITAPVIAQSALHTVDNNCHSNNFKNDYRTSKLQNLQIDVNKNFVESRLKRQGGVSGIISPENNEIVDHFAAKNNSSGPSSISPSGSLECSEELTIPHNSETSAPVLKANNYEKLISIPVFTPFSFERNFRFSNLAQKKWFDDVCCKIPDQINSFALNGGKFLKVTCLLCNLQVQCIDVVYHACSQNHLRKLTEKRNSGSIHKILSEKRNFLSKENQKLLDYFPSSNYHVCTSCSLILPQYSNWWINHFQSDYHFSNLQNLQTDPSVSTQEGSVNSIKMEVPSDLPNLENLQLMNKIQSSPISADSGTDYSWPPAVDSAKENLSSVSATLSLFQDPCNSVDLNVSSAIHGKQFETLTRDINDQMNFFSFEFQSFSEEPTLVCNLCQKSVVSSEVNKHLKEQEHLRNLVAKSSVRSDISGTPYISEENWRHLDFDTTSQEYSCTLCKVKLPSSKDSWIDHFQSTIHELQQSGVFSCKVEKEENFVELLCDVSEKVTHANRKDGLLNEFKNPLENIAACENGSIAERTASGNFNFISNFIQNNQICKAETDPTVNSFFHQSTAPNNSVVKNEIHGIIKTEPDANWSNNESVRKSKNVDDSDKENEVSSSGQIWKSEPNTTLAVQFEKIIKDGGSAEIVDKVPDWKEFETSSEKGPNTVRIRKFSDNFVDVLSDFKPANKCETERKEISNLDTIFRVFELKDYFVTFSQLYQSEQLVLSENVVCTLVLENSKVALCTACHCCMSIKNESKDLKNLIQHFNGRQHEKKSTQFGLAAYFELNLATITFYENKHAYCNLCTKDLLPCAPEDVDLLLTHFKSPEHSDLVTKMFKKGDHASAHHFLTVFTK